MRHEASINGQRFGTLRRLFSLTQKGLAEQLGVGQSFLSQIERGTRPAPALLALTAGEQFGLPESFFTVPTSPLETRPATYRKTSRATVKEDDRIGELYNEASRLFMELSERSGYRTGELPDPGDFGDDPELVAIRLRQAAGLDATEPVLNVTRSLERLGFGVIDELDEPRHESEHSGITRPAPWMERPLIALTSPAPGGVKRFTLAHEAYHHIADRHLPGPITSRRSAEEVRAFRFAGAFLLPAPVVRERISEHTPLNGYLAVKADYGITVSAMIHRAKDLGVISPGRAKSLYIQWSSSGWRKDEPVDVPDERPMLLAQAAQKVYGRHPVQRAAMDVGTSPAWIQRWCKLDSNPASEPATVVDFASERRRRLA